MQKETPTKDNIVLSNAQYKKSLSIAFFNATNAAIELIKGNEMPPDEKKKLIVEWRDWFLAEHKNYYATVIATVGVNYRAEESIAKLKTTKSLEDLQTVWVLLSEDERRDGEILKVAKELKAKYKNEKAQS